MKRTLVSLVSDQTIPNVEFIKEFGNENVDYIFITTKQKQAQLEWIIETTQIKNYEKIMVNPFDPNDILKKLNSYDYCNGELIINITGGTKLMSLVINEFFSGLDAVIYYLTGHSKTYIKLYPNEGERIFTLKTKITLREYLTAYGFDYEDTAPYKDFQTSERIFNNYKLLHKNNILDMFEPIRIRRGKSMKVESESLMQFLSNAKYDFSKSLSKKDTKYLSGDWFEEFVYFKIKNELNLNDDEIATGLNLKKDGTPNEIDVIFVLNHKLYIVECKTSIFDRRTIKRMREGEEVEEKKDINLLPEILYKSDALRGNFGLFANTSIFTLEEIKNDNGQAMESYKNHFKRAQLSNITIASKKDILHGKPMKEILGIKQ